MRAKKQFGQNFLQSSEIIDQIIQQLDLKKGENVVEVGPGLGALTLPLAENDINLFAVEFESDSFEAISKTVMKFNNIEVVNKDFLKLKVDEIPFDKFKLVGNLPYNITSPVIDWVISNQRFISQAVFMVQKEVAKRITSQPGEKDWSPLAIFTQLSFEAIYCLEVKPEHFSPPPKVTSAVIKLIPGDKTEVDDMERFEKLIRTAFKQRRKLLINNLGLIFDRQNIEQTLESLGLPSNIRAEQVAIEKFIALDRLLNHKN